jgi:hypothetical protein
MEPRASLALSSASLFDSIALAEGTSVSVSYAPLNSAPLGLRMIDHSVKRQNSMGPRKLSQHGL